MRRILTGKSKVFLAMLLSFLLVFSIPVSFEVLLYRQMEQSIRTQHSKGNVAMLEQLRQVLDQRLNEVDQLAVQVAFHPHLQLALSTNHENYLYFQLIQSLKALDNNPFIKDFFIYFKEKDIVLTPSIKTNSSIFFSKYYRYEQSQLNHLPNFITTYSGEKNYLPAQIVHNPFTNEKPSVITFLQGLPYGDSTPTALLGVLVYKEKISSLLHTINDVNQSTVFIFNEQRQLIMRTGGDDKLPIPSTQLMEGNHGSIETNVDGVMQNISYVKSNHNGWTYVSAIPKQTYSAPLVKVQNTALIFLILCLFIGLAASYFLTVWHYKPLEALVSSIIKPFHQTKLPRNEYAFITDTFFDMQEKEKTLEKQLHLQEPTMNEEKTRRLIQGIDNVSGVIEQFVCVSSYFVVVALEFEDDSLEEGKSSQWKLIQFLIQNICEDCFSTQGNIYTTCVEKDRIAIILNYKAPPSAHWISEMEERAVHIKQVLENTFQLSVTIGIGNVQSDIRKVKTSYQEALQALEYRFIKGKQVITFFEELSVEPHYYYPTDVEEQLINTIMSGDTAKALQLIDELFTLNFEDRNISLEVGQCLAFNLTSTLLKVLNRLSVKKAPWPAKLLEDMTMCRTAVEVLHLVKQYCETICEYVEQDRTDYQNEMYLEIKRMVQEHYADQSFNVAAIANNLDRTQQHVSTFFSKHHGGSLKDYVAKVRLSHAKSMLRNRNNTIADVAKAIGYANDIGVIRLFKKYEGITPGQYRDQQDDGESYK
ncbi:helix-turn-helix domain-containing protein [Aureibacillus halotolerans]|uniref:AraC-like DNA-binding protein n=1 Tax=Aureibacillus halotolerans TaxID=1508390 RepID=A0A4R6U665_9BACI|nr:helix-turn-helix domain-containing protein [Aureibacillus halotolerans]TDQ41072.1 AraC-like DNA-binding protein [Aureibacillus halotolerans]